MSTLKHVYIREKFNNVVICKVNSNSK